MNKARSLTKGQSSQPNSSHGPNQTSQPTMPTNPSQRMALSHMHLQCQCNSPHTATPALLCGGHNCTPGNGAELQELTQTTGPIPDKSPQDELVFAPLDWSGEPSIWDWLVFDQLILLNADHDPETVVETLSRDSLLLTCARCSSGWRRAALEENQIVAMADSRIAMRVINDEVL